MNSSEKGTQGSRPSFSDQYRADCEKILPDPEFLKRLETTLTTASHPDNQPIDLSISSLRFVKRKRQTKWIAAACFIILLGAAGIFAKIFLPMNHQLMENEVAGFMSSSACASSTGQTSAESEEEFANDAFEPTGQQDSMQDIYDSSEYDTGTEEEKLISEKGPEKSRDWRRDGKSEH